MKTRNSKIKYSLLLLLSFLIVAIVGVQIYWLDGLFGAVCEIVVGRTIYSKDYKEYAFRRIGKGASSNDVVRLLGQPLLIRTTRDAGETIWYYTRPKILDQNGEDGDCCYTERYIFLSNNVVTLKHNEFYFD